jgi:putative transcriptional regulator
MQEAFSSLFGSFLVADLDLADPNFSQTVVLIVEHNAEGALGLVINRPLGLTAEQILPVDLEGSQRRSAFIPVYSGGPVEPQAVFCLHTGLPQHLLSATARLVAPGLWFEPSFPSIQDYVAGVTPDLPPDDRPTLRVYLGYAGWGAGQLERELQQGAWQVLKARSSYVFFTPSHEIWRKAMEALGGFWGIVAQTGFKPSMN